MKLYTKYHSDMEGLSDVEATVQVIQKIAASQIQSARHTLSARRLYEAQIASVLSRLLLFASGFQHPLTTAGGSGNPAVVLLGSDKGLVGGLWHRIIDTVIIGKNTNHSVITVGEKMTDYCREEGISLHASFTGAELAGDTDLSEYLVQGFLDGVFSGISIAYARADSISLQSVQVAQFLPCTYTPVPPIDGDASGFPIFESSRSSIAGFLLTRYVRARLATMLAETTLSEFSARTVASEHAQEKTNELISALRRQYRNERRREVTVKQLETFVGNTMV